MIWDSRRHWRYFARRSRDYHVNGFGALSGETRGGKTREWLPDS
jgi:hypothetical protein